MPDEQSARELLEFHLAPPGYSFNFSRVPDEELERVLEVIDDGKQRLQGRPGVSQAFFFDVLDVLLRHACPLFHEQWRAQLNAGPDDGRQPH